MKNIIKTFVLAITIFLGVQETSAQTLTQDKSRPEVIAKAETANLTEALGLNGEQERTVFRALVAKEVGYQKNVAGKNSKDASVAAEKKNIDDQLKQDMKKTLTADQYNKWLKISD